MTNLSERFHNELQGELKRQFETEKISGIIKEAATNRVFAVANAIKTDIETDVAAAKAELERTTQWISILSDKLKALDPETQPVFSLSAGLFVSARSSQVFPPSIVSLPDANSRITLIDSSGLPIEYMEVTSVKVQRRADGVVNYKARFTADTFFNSRDKVWNRTNAHMAVITLYSLPDDFKDLGIEPYFDIAWNGTFHANGYGSAFLRQSNNVVSIVFSNLVEVGFLRWTEEAKAPK